jgi:putative ABC transport system permease protein
MNIQLILAARYLSGRKLRTILTTLAIVFGVFVIFSMNILLPSMLQALQANMLAANEVVDLTITHRTGEAFSPDVVAELNAVDGLRAVTGLLVRPINLPVDFFDKDPDRLDQIDSLAIVGVDPATVQNLHTYSLSAGRFLQPGDTYACVITTALADILGVSLKDSLHLPTAEGEVGLTIVGIRTPHPVPGTEEVIVTLADAQALLDQPGRINTVEADYAASEEARRAEIRRAVETALGKDFTLNASSMGTEMFGSLPMVQIGFNIFGALALLMGAFIIFNTFRTVVAERRHDLGLLRAVGASRRAILGIILVESLVQGGLGTILGMAMGYGTDALILLFLSPLISKIVPLHFEALQVSPALVLLTLAIGVGVTLLAGLLPAIRAGRVSPMEALRPAVADASYRRTLGATALGGSVLLGIALLALLLGNAGWAVVGGFLFLLGLMLLAPILIYPFARIFGSVFTLMFAREGTGLLAESNLTRQPTRAAITASTTMIALALIVALGGIVSSFNVGLVNQIRESIGSDYLFYPPNIATWGNNVGANQRFVERLQAVEGVRRISTLRYASAVADVRSVSIKGNSTTEGMAVSILGIDPVTFPQVSSLNFQAGDSANVYAAMAGGRAMVVNPLFAANAGLEIGDAVPLSTPEGTQMYHVVGIGGNVIDMKITTAYISQANLAADFHKTDDIYIILQLAPRANTPAAEKALQAVRKDYPQFTMVNGKALADQIEVLIPAAFGSLYILLALLAVPSLIAMLNTLAIMVIERTREIGMLRAIGTTQKQIRRMVLAEALLLAAIGSALGVLAGLYLGYALIGAMRNGGFPLPYSFPAIGILIAIAVGLTFGALAAFIPSRQAAKMEIVQALRYE